MTQETERGGTLGTVRGTSFSADSDKIRDALEFYRVEAEALARYMAEGKENRAHAILASVTVLSLDGGRRAREALQP